MKRSMLHLVIIEPDHDQFQSKSWLVHPHDLRNIWTFKPSWSFHTMISSFASQALQNSSLDLSPRRSCLVHVLFCAKLLFISFAFDLSPNDEINMQRRSSCTGDCKLGPEFHQLGPPLVFLVGWTLRVLLVMLIILVTVYKHHLYPFCSFKDLIS